MSCPTNSGAYSWISIAIEYGSWPLEQPADVRIDVRIEHIVAQSDGQFRLAGQYSVASPDFVVRESINRFDILQPLADTTPASVAAASGAAVLALADLIIARLRR